MGSIAETLQTPLFFHQQTQKGSQPQPAKAPFTTQESQQQLMQEFDAHGSGMPPCCLGPLHALACISCLVSFPPQRVFVQQTSAISLYQFVHVLVGGMMCMGGLQYI